MSSVTLEVKGVNMINKFPLMCVFLSCTFSVCSAMESLESITKLEDADRITNCDSETEQGLIQKKCSTYEELANKDSGQAGRWAQLRMAVIWHNGLFGYAKSTYKAMPYWTALSSQKDEPALRVLALEMLGVYHKEGWQSIGSAVKPDLAKAKSYFIQASDASNDNELKKQFLEEIRLINKSLY
jgi:TPR repeat protein